MSDIKNISTDLRKFLLPLLTKSLKSISINSLNDSTSDYDIKFGNLHISSLQWMEQNLEVLTHQLEGEGTVLAKLSKVQMKSLSGATFYLKRKTFPSMEDTGSVDIDYRGSEGATIVFRFKYIQERTKLPFILEHVHVDLDKIRLTVTSALHHEWLTSIFVSLFGNTLQKKLETAIEQNIQERFEDAELMSLTASLEKIVSDHMKTTAKKETKSALLTKETPVALPVQEATSSVTYGKPLVSTFSSSPDEITIVVKNPTPDIHVKIPPPVIKLDNSAPIIHTGPTPEVTVTPNASMVNVNIPKPVVNMGPAPHMNVTAPAPHVNIAAAKPKIIVEAPKEITAVAPAPHINIETSAPTINVPKQKEVEVLVPASSVSIESLAPHVLMEEAKQTTVEAPTAHINVMNPMPSVAVEKSKTLNVVVPTAPVVLEESAPVVDTGRSEEVSVEVPSAKINIENVSPLVHLDKPKDITAVATPSEVVVESASPIVKTAKDEDITVPLLPAKVSIASSMPEVVTEQRVEVEKTDVITKKKIEEVAVQKRADQYSA